MKPDNSKPFVDLNSFQRFLSAAYVVQQHNDRLRQPTPGAESSSALSQFAELEEEIRKRGLDLPTATRLIATPAQQAARADGAAIAIIEKDQLVYYAATGTASAEAGVRVAQSASVCAECLQSGELLAASDAERDLRLPAGFCRDHGIKALLAAPARLQGKVVGVVELRFSQSRAFREEETRNCQLVADLVAAIVEHTRALAAPAPPPDPMDAAETMDVAETLQRIKPQLAQLAGDEEFSSVGSTAATSPVFSCSDTCPSCGHPLGADEQFCGLCGTAHSPERPGAGTWSTLWDLQRHAEEQGAPLGFDEPDHSLDVSPSEMEALMTELSGDPADSHAPPPSYTPAPQAPAMHVETQVASSPAPVQSVSIPLAIPEKLPQPAPLASVPSPPASAAPPPEPPALPAFGRPTVRSATPPVEEEYAPWQKESSTSDASLFPSFASGRMPDDEPEPAPPRASPAPANSLAPPPGSTSSDPQWGSAVKTRAWLDSLQEERSGLGRLLLQWRAHRANVYLAAAAALLVMVLLGGGAQDSTRTTAQNPDPKAPPQPELSVFDKALISLGLAEPPPVPVDAGNPGTRVWVDTHTALYYCPGSDLYGKTQGGRFATQQEAEMDAFQPASRKPCD